MVIPMKGTIQFVHCSNLPRISYFVCQLASLVGRGCRGQMVDGPYAGGSKMEIILLCVSWGELGQATVWRHAGRTKPIPF